MATSAIDAGKFKEAGLLTMIAGLFDNRKYSDLLVRTKAFPYQAHKLVVCLQSEVLAALVDSGRSALRANSTELDSRTILDLSDDDPDTVGSMLQFLYTKDYSSRNTDGKALLYEAKIYAMAEKYSISGLKHMAARKYEVALEAEWNTPDFTQSLKLIYDRPSDSDSLLKDIAINFAATKARELAEQPDFAALCKEKGQIGYDVFTASLKLTNLKIRLSRTCSGQSNSVGRRKSGGIEKSSKGGKQEEQRKKELKLLWKREKEEQRRMQAGRSPGLFSQPRSTTASTSSSNPGKPEGVCNNLHKVESSIYWATFAEGSRKCPLCKSTQIDWRWADPEPEPEAMDLENGERVQCASQ